MTTFYTYVGAIVGSLAGTALGLFIGSILWPRKKR